MAATVEITVSTQVKSANAVSDIKNHSGKENRETYAHKNPDIDKSKSHLNAEFDFYDRMELLENHYGEVIEKHNKNNNSASRKWDIDKYLATFEGKTVMRKGEATKNVRWSTVSQISYFGGKDSLNDVLKALEEAGAPPEEIRAAYLSGYEEYVQKHNDTFPTLPIYHSDVHFDETTPHGHDAIVVMGHTEKGRPSDSINNALGEMYGYKPGFKGNQENMVLYREQNDNIIFNSIGSKLEALGSSYDLDFNFEFLRTGETGSATMEDYKKNQDYAEVEQQLEFRTKAQKKTTEKHRERKRDLDSREKALVARERDLPLREGSVIAKEKELEEKEKALAASKLALIEKERKIASVELAVGDVTTTILSFSNSKYDHKLAGIIATDGLGGLDRQEIKEVRSSLDFAIFDAVKNKESEVLKKEVEKKAIQHKHVPLKTHIQQVIEDDGPQL